MEMARMTVESAREAIRLSVLCNGGGAMYMFSKFPSISKEFVIAAICFAAGFFSCMIAALLAYLSQYEYGNSVKVKENNSIEIEAKSDEKANCIRLIALFFGWVSIIIPLSGFIFVVAKVL